MTIEVLPQDFSVCKIQDGAAMPTKIPFCFTAETDEERSLVCPTADVPKDTLYREDGWRGFHLVGTLEFSMIGVLADISTHLAKAQIPIFAVSTYNTDYIFTKVQHFKSALEVLKAAGYTISS